MARLTVFHRQLFVSHEFIHQPAVDAFCGGHVQHALAGVQGLQLAESQLV